MGPDPAVAAIRSAVRRALDDLTPGDLVLVACSGGADSVALAAAAAFVAPRQSMRSGGVTVDHGLQGGSGDRADDVVALLRRLGMDPVERVTVTVGTHGGVEAAARTARYDALSRIADRSGAAAVLLGHTCDDQAETVLLGLARGSGARSLAGMAARSGRYRRPLLQVDRATTWAACGALGLVPWEDPHNADPAFARARVRHEALPVLERSLGPGMAAALARTAALLRVDADALDDWAQEAAGRLRDGDGGLDVTALAALPRAVRTRVIRRAAIAAGSKAGALTAGHVDGIDSLVTGWHGQRWIDLPGGVRAIRRCGRLLFAGQAVEPTPASDHVRRAGEESADDRRDG